MLLLTNTQNRYHTKLLQQPPTPISPKNPFYFYLTFVKGEGKKKKGNKQEVLLSITKKNRQLIKQKKIPFHLTFTRGTLFPSLFISSLTGQSSTHTHTCLSLHRVNPSHSADLIKCHFPRIQGNLESPQSQIRFPI
jgi:hypothetical protein